MSNQNRPCYLGIDVGGTNIKVGLTDDVGTVLGAAKVETDTDEGLKAGIDNLEAAVREVLTKCQVTLEQVQGVGLACPGPMDLKTGQLLNLTNLPSWRNIPVRHIVEERLGRPVVLQNDANAAAYGEYWAGAARGSEISVLWTLGTGIGSGIVIKGEILEGAHSHAAECGYLIVETEHGREHPEGGYHGTLEAYASSRAIIARCNSQLKMGAQSSLQKLYRDHEEITPLMIMQHAEQGDGFAHGLIMEVARYLGVGTVSLMHTVDPEMVLIGGAMTFGQNATRTGRDFLERIKQEIQKRAFPIPAQKTRIEFAQLGSEAGFIGAAGCAAKAFPVGA